MLTAGKAAAIEHVESLRGAVPPTRPLIARFDVLAHFAAAAGEGGAPPHVIVTAINLLEALCAGWATARAALLAQRRALFTLPALLAHPAGDVRASTLRLLLALAPEPAAAAPLVAAGAVQGVLDLLAQARDDEVLLLQLLVLLAQLPQPVRVAAVLRGQVGLLAD